MARIRNLDREHFWRQHHFRQRSSGLTVVAYCKREAIAHASFYAWKRRLGTSSVPAVTKPPFFIPLNVSPTSSPDHAASDHGVEVKLPQDVYLRLATLPEPEWLCGIVAGLANLHHKEAVS